MAQARDAIHALTSGIARTFARSAVSFATIGCGVPAGMYIAYHEVTS